MFTTAATNLPGVAAKLSSHLFLIVGAVFLFSFIYSFGAAKLSYAYNTSVGSSLTFLWAVLAFIFSGMYYPYYAFFVNPVGAPPASIMSPMMGGKRRK